MNIDNLKEILLEICKNNSYSNYCKYGITVELIIDLLIKNEPIHATLRDRLGLSKNAITVALRNMFPDRIPTKHTDIRLWLLLKINLKLCSGCSTLLHISDYYANKSKVNNINSYCKDCSKQSRKQAYYKYPNKEISSNRVRKINRNTFQTPLWADLESITIFYKNTPKGFHVDHIIPLNNNVVCGLHVLNNLQYLTIEDNLRKGNTFNIHIE